MEAKRAQKISTEGGVKRKKKKDVSTTSSTKKFRVEKKKKVSFVAEEPSAAAAAAAETVVEDKQARPPHVVKKPLVLNSECDDTVPSFSLRPMLYRCTCVPSEKYAPYIDMSRRFFKTAQSLLDSADVEFLYMLHRYRSVFMFVTPEFEAFKTSGTYALTVSLRDNPSLPSVPFPVMFRSRLDVYCRFRPNAEVFDTDEVANMESTLDCPFCCYDFFRNVVPNTFKFNGKIQCTTNFMILKEKRKPFVDKDGNMCWFVVKKKFKENDVDAITCPQNRFAFRSLVDIKHFFCLKSYVGHSSIMTTGNVFSKLLSNFLCVVHGTTPCKFKYDKNYKRYTSFLNKSNLDSAFGNIRFEQVDGSYGTTDSFMEYAFKMAQDTQKKSQGFHKNKTTFLQVRGDMQCIFGVTKKLAYMSKETECKEISRSDLGLIAIPDTTDSKNCGLMCQLVPGVFVSNRLTCRLNIAEIFCHAHLSRAVATDDSFTLLLVDAYCDTWNVFGCTKRTLLDTVLELVGQGIHFDFNADAEKNTGYIFSFHGTLVYDRCGMTAETKSWIADAFPYFFRGEQLDIISYSCFSIPFINHTSNSKIVGSSKSRQQEIDYPVDPEVPPVYSQTDRTHLNYPQKALNNEHDVGTLQNVVVGICCLGANNVEEGILVNKQAVERGLFSTTEYKRVPLIFVRKSQKVAFRIANVSLNKPLRSKELVMEVVGVDVCTQYSNDLRVENRPNGFLVYYCGSFERKVWKIDSYDTRFVTGNSSVERVTVVLVLKSSNYCCEGDKLTTLHAQKGIVSRFLPSEDFPFFQSGVVPDVLLNVGYYDRMTLGQDLDGLVGTRVSLGRRFERLFNGELVFDADVDREVGEDYVEDLFDGATGEFLGPAKVHILPYRRLRQEADQFMQSTVREVQKRDVTTCQYQKGKCNRGGASIGTMENVNVYAIGSKAFSKQITDLSSGYFENPRDPEIGKLNRTASSINKILMVHGLRYKLYGRR